MVQVQVVLYRPCLPASQALSGVCPLCLGAMRVHATPATETATDDRSAPGSATLSRTERPRKKEGSADYYAGKNPVAVVNRTAKWGEARVAQGEQSTRKGREPPGKCAVK